MESTNQTHTEGAVAKSIEQHTANCRQTLFSGRRPMGVDAADSRPLQQARETAWLGSHQPRWRLRENLGIALSEVPFHIDTLRLL